MKTKRLLVMLLAIMAFGIQAWSYRITDNYRAEGGRLKESLKAKYHSYFRGGFSLTHLSPSFSIPKMLFFALHARNLIGRCITFPYTLVKRY